MKMRMTPLACLLAPLLSACGGGESDEAPLTPPDYRLTVKLPAAGTLCVNLNQNDSCEPGEPVVSGEAGARQLSASAPGLLTSPLLFIPRDPGALTLTHPAAPLQPGQGLAALAQLEEFNRALEALALATRDDAASLPALTASDRQRQIWQGLVTLLPELAQHFAASPELLSQQARLASVLMQQQPRALVTASGVTTYTDGVDYLLTQEPADHPGQEASLGQAPLRYRKLDGKGQPLADNAPDWECVEDLNTGLIWEKKLDDADSPRDLHRVFAWEFGNYHPSQAELDYACPQGEAICSTEQYRQWLNAQRLCGIGHWRLPTAQELGSLQHYGSLARQDGQLVSLDVRYFPDVGPSSGDFDGSYWTQTLTPSRRLESVPIAVISPQFLGEDAGTDYPYGVQNENEINAIQLRLVAEVTR